MRRIAFLFFAFAITFFSQEAYGQYLPIGILPMEYNSSFAGSVANSRMVSNFIFQNTGSDKYYSSTGGGINLSYDRYFPNLRSGFGVVVNGYYSTNSTSSWYYKYLEPSVEFMIAPKISINGKYTLSPSISIKYTKFFLERENSWHSGSDNFSSKFGLLFNTSHYYIGYAAEYNYGSSGLTTALQFGYTFQKSLDSKFSFTPQFALPILINSGVDIYWPSYNLSFRYGSFILGAISQFAYEYPTGFQVGWQNNAWRVLLSNNFKDINNNYTDQYTANFTLRYIFNHDKQSRNILY